MISSAQVLHRWVPTGLILIGILLMTACEDTDDTGATSPTIPPASTTLATSSEPPTSLSPIEESLVGVWVLRSITFEESDSPISGIRTWVSFLADGSFNGESPCNDVEGSYSVFGEVLLTDGVTASAVGCDPRFENVDLELDEQVLDHFWQVDVATVTFDAAGDELVWVTPVSTAVFDRAAAPPPKE